MSAGSAPSLEQILAEQLGSALPASTRPLAGWLAQAFDLPADLSLYQALHGTTAPAVPTAQDEERRRRERAALGLALSRLQPPRRPVSLDVPAADAEPQALSPALHDALLACLDELGQGLGQGAQVPGGGAAAKRATAPAGAEDIALRAPNPACWSPLSRYYLLEQRKLSSHLATLRTRLRQALQRSGGARARLAALDEALEQGLSAQEARLLARLPRVLEHACAHHWAHWSHWEQSAATTDEQQASAATVATVGTEGSPDPDPDSDPAQAEPLPAWLLACAASLQDLLAAETRLRLLPLQGLLASLDETSSPSPVR